MSVLPDTGHLGVAEEFDHIKVSPPGVFDTSFPNSSKPSSCQTTFLVFGSTSIRSGWPGRRGSCR